MRFELTIKKDTNHILKNFGTFYKSSIKYFYKTNTSFTGIDIADHLSLSTNKIIFKGSFSEKQNLTLNYKTDGSLENAVMNYNSTIIVRFHPKAPPNFIKVYHRSGSDVMFN